MSIVDQKAVFAAIEKAVHIAIAEIGGVEALKKTSMFPSSKADIKEFKRAA